MILEAAVCVLVLLTPITLMNKIFQASENVVQLYSYTIAVFSCLIF
jgi:hypothetical protein